MSTSQLASGRTLLCTQCHKFRLAWIALQTDAGVDVGMLLGFVRSWSHRCRFMGAFALTSTHVCHTVTSSLSLIIQVVIAFSCRSQTKFFKNNNLPYTPKIRLQSLLLLLISNKNWYLSMHNVRVYNVILMQIKCSKLASERHCKNKQL